MLEDLPYINENGKRVAGAAAFVHRVFNKTQAEQEERDRKADLKELQKLIQECGYATFDD